MSTIADISVPYGIVHREPPTLESDGQGWTASATLSVAYGADTVSLLNTICGTTATVNGVLRLIPLQHPDFPLLLADKVSVRAVGGQRNNGAFWGTGWSQNFVRIEFRSFPFQVSGDRAFLNVNIKQGSQTITMPGNSYYFPSDGSPLQQDAGFDLSTTEYTITQYFCPTVGDDVVASFQNKANSAIISIGALACPVGTLLFTGGDTTTEITAAGNTNTTRVLNYKYRSVPHNLILRPNGKWEAPINRFDGNPVFGSADLTPLFQF